MSESTPFLYRLILNAVGDALDLGGIGASSILLKKLGGAPLTLLQKLFDDEPEFLRLNGCAGGAGFSGGVVTLRRVSLVAVQPLRLRKLYKGFDNFGRYVARAFRLLPFALGTLNPHTTS
jgi:hypothetical protein